MQIITSEAQKLKGSGHGGSGIGHSGDDGGNSRRGTGQVQDANNEQIIAAMFGFSTANKPSGIFRRLLKQPFKLLGLIGCIAACVSVYFLRHN